MFSYYNETIFDDILVANRAFGKSTWVNDKRHSWKEWRYGHSLLAVDGKLDNSLPNCAIMDNYYVDKPVWMVDLGKSNTKVNGVIVYTWQGAGQGRIPNYNLYLPSFRLYPFYKTLFYQISHFLKCYRRFVRETGIGI